MNLFEQLRKYWTDAQIPVVDPATPDEVAAFENRHGIDFPDEFKDYLLVAGGMPEGITDEDMLCFASLQTLDDPSGLRWTLPNTSRKLLIFADFLIFSNWFLIDVGHDAQRGTVFGAIDQDDLVKLTSTFKEFIEAYFADPDYVAWKWVLDAPFA